MADSGVIATRLRTGWRIIGICMLGVVWWGCLTPSPPQVLPPFPYFDKFEHFIAYLGLAAWFAAIYVQRRQRLVILILLIVMGGAIEILQGYTGRDPEWLDWLADIIGTLSGLAWPARWFNALYQYFASKHVQSV